MASNASAGTKAMAAKARELTAALEEIKDRHASASGYTSVPTMPTALQIEEGDQMNQEYLNGIKTYISLIEKSKYINNSDYSSQINIPPVGTLIQAVDHYNAYLTVIDSLGNICAQYANHANYSNCAHYNAWDDYWNWNAAQ